MSKIYNGCMKYMVYRIFDGDGLGPLYFLVAQFDDIDDVQLYIDAKCKYMGRRYGVLSNEEGAVFQERLLFLSV